jgi:hypothetical protein
VPPRWSRKPDRNDPEFRRLDDRMTFATHVAAFSAVNSGIWFFYQLQQADWAWAKWVTGGWALVLIFHMIFIFAIADYSTTKSNG